MTAAAKAKVTFVSSISAARRRRIPLIGALALVLAAGIAAPSPADAATPKIRTSSSNAVPACVTPDRLMAFLRQRNPNPEPRFRNIAEWYKRHGEAWRVRWDYAFFQMAVETNFLTYKRANGSWGDARPKQNNFAGLGTTGGGVPGDSFPDVGTGVLAQIQHLVVYSGEYIPSPVGPRTKLKQDVILKATGSKKGRMTFADLAGRWAADKHYGAAIEWVAGRYRKTYCTGSAAIEAKAQPPARPLPRATALGGPTATYNVAANTQRVADKKSAPVRTIWSRGNQPTAPAAPPARTEPPEIPTKAPTATARQMPPQTPPSSPPPAQQAPEAPQIELSDQEQAPAETARDAGPQPGQPNLQAFAFAGRLRIAAVPSAQGNTTSAGTCDIVAASYGGEKTLLVRGAETSGTTRYTVLTVLAGFERSMLDSYIKTHAPGGMSLGEFESKDAAIAKARQLCPTAAQTTQAGQTRNG